MGNSLQNIKTKKDVSPGLFSWGLPAGSSFAGFSVGMSFFSWVELRLPRRPGERSAGEGSAPEREEMLNGVISLCLSVIHSFILSVCVCFFIFIFKVILTVDLISWRQKPDVCQGDSSSVSIIKLHHHTALFLLLTWTSLSTTHRTEEMSCWKFLSMCAG